MIYKPKDFAKLVGVTVHTLQVWDRENKLPAKRTVTNQRYYTEEDLAKALGKIPQRQRVSVGYARVSTQAQKNNLQNQINFISQYSLSKGEILDTIYSDIASGLNYKRNNWNKLLKRVRNNEIDTIYITYKDRFVRFGFDWFEGLCKEHDTKIVILNQKQTSPEEELIEDMLSILHVFSARSYGLRSYKNKLQKEIKGKEE